MVSRKASGLDSRTVTTPRGAWPGSRSVWSPAFHFPQRMPGELHGIRRSPVRSRPRLGDRARSSANRAPDMFPVSLVAAVLLGDECRWNYIAQDDVVAGSSPASGSRRRSSSVVEHVNVSSTWSSPSLCPPGPVDWWGTTVRLCDECPWNYIGRRFKSGHGGATRRVAQW